MKEAVFGVGLMEELSRHGYAVSPGTLYPTLSKMESGGFLICETQIVDHKQRKYYRVTPEGRQLLDAMREKIKELYQEIMES